MGYSIKAIHGGAIVAEIEAYMGAFEMCREQGYDWFDLLDANDHDCGCSGCGESKRVSLSRLRAALQAALDHDPGDRMATGRRFQCGQCFNYKRDEWTYRKSILIEFMARCVKYCEQEGLTRITVRFE